jgi:thiamine biosynthesis lipoprotein
MGGAVTCWRVLLADHRGSATRAAALLSLAAAGLTDAPAQERFAFEQPHMATLWRVTLYAASEAEARAAAEAAFARVAELEKVMSDYDPSSEVRQLGTDWGPVSGDLLAVLEASQQIGAASGGAFDVTLGALSRLWKRAIRRGEMPGDEALAAARATAGPGMLQLDPAGRRARVGDAGTRIDLGGIGKGFALDEALEVLREGYGIKRVLIDAGGDVVAGDPPPGVAGWSVEVRGNGPPWKVSVANLAVATSGDLYQHAVVGDVRVSHLIDPRTGQALADGAAATVVCASATEADALASALCVLGEREGRALAEEFGAEARATRGGTGEVPATPSAWESAGLAALRIAD